MSVISSLVQAELKQMEVRIGVAEHTLLQVSS